MKQNVNYIKHHKAVNMKLIDSNLSSTHISVYNALFLLWNECGFDTELSINRNDVMKLSKIGSANTYTKCLKELDNFGVIKYKPSYNPLIGSIINLYRFDKGSDNSSDNSTAKSSSKGCGEGSATLSKQLNEETTKLINNNPDLLNNNLKVWISESKELVLDNEDKKVREEQFELFWNKYPKKTNKKDSKIKFLKLKEDEVIKIFSTIDEFIRYKPFDKYQHPNPTTYINQKRWDDELNTTVKVTPKYHI